MAGPRRCVHERCTEQCSGRWGYTLRAVELKAKPYLDADTLVKLPERAEIEIMARNGPWMLVKTKAKQSGYVRLLQVRLGTSASSSDQGGWLSPSGIEATST